MLAASRAAPILLAIFGCVPALAHTQSATKAGDFLAAGAPFWVSACLALSALLYGLGLRGMWRRASAPHAMSAKTPLFFAMGWLVVAVALLSPLDTLGGRLFAAHMVQHELLILVAAPLVVLGRPLALFMWAFPTGARHALAHSARQPWLHVAWAALTHPLTAWALHAAALWGWHAPAFFERALADETDHAVQHASFLGTAALFWWSVWRKARPDAGALLSVFTTMMHSGALGALLTFSTAAWYPAYASTSAEWGLSLIEDQQLGGLVMWVPGGLAYLAAGLVLASRWLRADERSSSACIPGDRPSWPEGRN